MEERRQAKWVYGASEESMKRFSSPLDGRTQQIAAISIEQIEAVKKYRHCLRRAILQQLECGSALLIQGDDLAVDDKVSRQLFQRRNDSRKTAIECLLIARKQRDVVAVLDRDGTIA